METFQSYAVIAFNRELSIYQAEIDADRADHRYDCHLKTRTSNYPQPAGARCSTQDRRRLECPCVDDSLGKKLK